MEKADNVASVMKVFAILEAIAEGSDVNLTGIAKRALTSTSTAHRFLQTMKRLGYVRQNGEDDYGLTLKFVGLVSNILQSQDNIVAAADPFMKHISETTREAINLGILDESSHSVVYIHKYDSYYRLGTRAVVGQRNPLYNTALGKVLLSWLDEAAARAHLETVEFVPFTRYTLTSVEAVMADLSLIRERGYAEDNEEGELGVYCLAVPIFDHRHSNVGALSLSFPIARYSKDQKDKYISMLREASAGISGMLGLGSG